VAQARGRNLDCYTTPDIPGGCDGHDEGKAAVVKPASGTPVTGGLLLAMIFEEAGCPQAC
jgi:hypothetical protein